NAENTFSSIWHGFTYIAPVAVIIGVAALAILYVWGLPAIKKNKILQLIPAPLLVVGMGILVNYIFEAQGSSLALSNGHLVALPVAQSVGEFAGFLNFPQLEFLTDPEVWK